MSAIVFVWFFGALLLSLIAVSSPEFPPKNYAVVMFAVALTGLLLNFKPTKPAWFEKIRKVFNLVLYVADMPWAMIVFLFHAFFSYRIPMSVTIFSISSVVVPVILLFCEEKSNTCEISLRVQRNKPLPHWGDYILLFALILSASALFLSHPIFSSAIIASIPCTIYITDLIACRYGCHKWGNTQFIFGLIFLSSAWVCQIVNHFSEFFKDDIYFTPPVFLLVSSAIFILSAFYPLRKANKQ